MFYFHNHAGLEPASPSLKPGILSARRMIITRIYLSVFWISRIVPMLQKDLNLYLPSGAFPLSYATASIWHTHIDCPLRGDSISEAGFFAKNCYYINRLLEFVNTKAP